VVFDKRLPVFVTLKGTRCSTFGKACCWFSRSSCAGVASSCRAEALSSISDHTSDPECDTFLLAWIGDGSSVEEFSVEADGVDIGDTGVETDVGVLVV